MTRGEPTRPFDCQVEYWNRMGPSKQFGHPVNFERVAQRVGADDRILDYGCGCGRVSGLLYEHGYRNLLGVDPAGEMIAEARRRFPAISFEHLVTPPRVDLPTGSVAAVLLFAVLTCVPDDEGQLAIIGEASRLLRPNGLLYISDLWLQTDSRNIERYVRGESRYGKYGVFDLPEGATLRHHDRRWIETLTRGYNQVARQDIQVQTMNGHEASGFQWFGLKQAAS